MTEVATTPDIVIKEPTPTDIDDSFEEQAPLEKTLSMLDVEDETNQNTKLNALLYHTSEDSVELYKLQNNSSDLLGRLYYDDYDSESIISPLSSGQVTPLSPVPSGTMPLSIPSLDLVYITNAAASSRSSSQTRLPSQQSRPGLPRLQSFERGISFDIPDVKSKKSLIVKVKHPQFKFRRNNKTFLVGFNDDFESSKAIEWLFDEMVIHGDTVVIFQVLNEKYHQEIDKVKANLNLENFEQLNCHNKKVSIIFETVIGKAQKKLKKAIDEYSPSVMIIGTHEGNKDHHHRTILKSSLSKHFLECALVPVIVVKPSYTYIEELKAPIDSELYFQNWMKNISEQCYNHLSEQQHHHRKGISRILSPSPSRSSSYKDLVSEERGRKQHDTPSSSLAIRSPSREGRSRSTSKSRGFASFFMGH